MKLLVSGLVAAADKRHVSCHRCDAHAIMLAGTVADIQLLHTSHAREVRCTGMTRSMSATWTFSYAPTAKATSETL